MASTSTSAFDLTTEAGVVAYLADSPFACNNAEALLGGTGNFVFRMFLCQPHEGKATLVLKHARPYVKNLPDIPIDTQRQVFEVEALRRIREWVPSTAFITVPKIYHFDEEEHVIIMEDSGSDSITLKEYMQKGLCSMETAHRIGQAVGSFIGQLHSWGEHNRDISEFFEANHEAKRISSWVSYGLLLQTFDGELEKLQNPDVNLSTGERRALGEIAEEFGNDVKKATGTFVMGDFWPGNLVLSFDKERNLRQVMVLDWEMCKPGLYGDELGQFCAELVLLMRFNAEVCGSTANIMLEELLKAYANHITPDLEMCRRIVVRLGTHLVTLTPRSGWGEKEMTQQVVKEGLKLVLDGYSAEKEWLEKSAIGSLVLSIA